MKASVNQDLCTGCGLCTDSCPEVFVMNDSGIAEARPGEVPADEEQKAKDAAADCPVEAITVE